MGFLRTFFAKINWLLGEVDETILEMRIFNGICLLGIAITFYNIPFSFIVGLYTTGVIFIFITALLMLLYYLSRFKKKYKYSVLACGVMLNILFAVNYFHADGVSGASLLSFTLLIFAMVIISPKTLHLFWFVLIFITIWGIMMAEYFFPDSVYQSYGSMLNKMVDMGSTVTINLVIITIALVYLKKEYYREKSKADANMRELKAMNDQKTKLFSVLSHDIKTSLHSLSLYLELIKTESLEASDRRQMEDLLSSSVHSTQAMLSNILHWSKGQLISVKSDLLYQNISVLLEETVDLYRHEAERKKIQYTYSRHRPVHAIVNAEMFKIVIGNLIANALKFTKQGGLVQVSLRTEQNVATIEVKDDGQGIDDDKQKHLFSLEMDSSYGTSQEKGVGLGLYLCKQFTEEQNGEIGFESKAGFGSRFFVKFPQEVDVLLQQTQ